MDRHETEVMGILEGGTFTNHSMNQEVIKDNLEQQQKVRIPRKVKMSHRKALRKEGFIDSETSHQALRRIDKYVDSKFGTSRIQSRLIEDEVRLIVEESQRINEEFEFECELEPIFIEVEQVPEEFITTV